MQFYSTPSDIGSWYPGQQSLLFSCHPTRSDLLGLGNKGQQSLLISSCHPTRTDLTPSGVISQNGSVIEKHISVCDYWLDQESKGVFQSKP